MAIPVAIVVLGEADTPARGLSAMECHWRAIDDLGHVPVYDGTIFFTSDLVAHSGYSPAAHVRKGRPSDHFAAARGFVSNADASKDGNIFIPIDSGK
jgi:hypothetical protein